MEALDIKLSAEAFDKAVHAPDALRECGDLALCIKLKATAKGNPAVVITFSVDLPSGFKATAQAVITWAMLRDAVKAGDAMIANAKK